MQAAMKAAVEGLLSINQAAAEHGVPKSSLKDWLSGKVQHGTNPGRRPYLTESEERELEVFLMKCSQMGYGKTRKDVLQIVEKISVLKGIEIEDQIADGWYHRFKNRVPSITIRRGDPYVSVRADCCNRQTYEKYFAMLKELLNNYDLVNKPGQVYNCDESGMPFDAHPQHVVTSKKMKKVRSRTSGNKSQTTVLACANAAGQVIPPMVIFDLKNLQHQLTEAEVPGTLYGLSEKGWIDGELFNGWLSKHFLKYATAERPLLLLLDGHSSHYMPSTLRFAREHGIVMFAFPPHTTADSQPLDVCCFGPLKRRWREVCHEFIQKNPGKVVNRFHFSALFAKAWLKSMTPDIILSAFKASGVYPFNPEEVLKHYPDSELSSSQPLLPMSNESPANLPPPALPRSEGPIPALTIDVNPFTEFNDEELELFQKRFDECYDVPDERYTLWLKLYHPEALLSDAHASVDDYSQLQMYTFASCSQIPDDHSTEPEPQSVTSNPVLSQSTPIPPQQSHSSLELLQLPSSPASLGTSLALSDLSPSSDIQFSSSVVSSPQTVISSSSSSNNNIISTTTSAANSSKISLVRSPQISTLLQLTPASSPHMSVPSSAKSPQVPIPSLTNSPHMSRSPSLANSPQMLTSSLVSSPQVSTPSSTNSPQVSTPSSINSPQVSTSSSTNSPQVSTSSN